MRTLPAIAILLALSAPAVRAADPVVLLLATGANVGEGELAAATDLLRGDLEQTGRFTVHLGQRPGGNVPEPTPADAAEEARSAGASLAVTLRISRLGASTMARLAAYRPDGTLWHADQLGAANPDDLDPVLQRLAQGLAHARPAAELAELDTVTEREATPRRKLASTHVFGLRLGATWFANRPGDHETRRLSGGGVFWLYDARSFLADVTIDFATGSSEHLLATGLGLYLPFTKGNVTPYLGGGLEYELAQTQDDGEAGLAVRGTGGLLVGRLSTVQLRVEAGYRVSGFTIRVNGDRRVIQGPFLTAGIGF